MKKIFLGGITGTGKTSVAKLLEQRNKNITIFSFGSELSIVAKNIISEYNGINNLTIEQRNTIISRIKEKLNKIIESEMHEYIIIDNHFTVFLGNDIINTFSDDEIVFYDGIIILTLSTKNIISRILEDKIKVRDNIYTNEEFIKENQEKELKRAKYLSMVFNKKILQLVNNKLNETVVRIENFIINI